MKLEKNGVKINSYYNGYEFAVDRICDGTLNMWGSYCPDTGEYYLAYDAGEYTGVVASAEFMPNEEWQEQTAWGYESQAGGLEVVRELLRLGHLLPQTLTNFIEAGGVIWWNQPTTK